MRSKEARWHQSPGKAIKYFLGKISSRAAEPVVGSWNLKKKKTKLQLLKVAFWSFFGGNDVDLGRKYTHNQV